MLQRPVEPTAIRSHLDNFNNKVSCAQNSVLSQVLMYRINRCVNLIMGLIAIAIIVMNNLSPDLDNIFFMFIEIITLVFIIGTAWRWKVEAT